MIKEITNTTKETLKTPIEGMNPIIAEGTIVGQYQVIAHDGMQDGVYLAGPTRETIEEAIALWNNLWETKY